MRKVIFTCDHCGKELDEMRDYPDVKIDNFIDYVTADLCSDCLSELNEVVLKYINQKQGKQK